MDSALLNRETKNLQNLLSKRHPGFLEPWDWSRGELPSLWSPVVTTESEVSRAGARRCAANAFIQNAHSKKFVKIWPTDYKTSTVHRQHSPPSHRAAVSVSCKSAMRTRKIRNRNGNIIAHPFDAHLRPPAPGVIDLTRTQPPNVSNARTTIRQLPPALPSPHARVVNNTALQHAPVQHTRSYVRAVNNPPLQNASRHGMVLNNALHSAPHAALVHNAPVPNTRPQVRALNHPLQNVPLQLQNMLARFHQALNPNQPNPYPLPQWGAPKLRQALRWTDLEDSFLQSIIHHTPVPWGYVMNMLPHRTRSAIMQRLSMLKALNRNVRQELDFILSRDEVEVIVIDDDDEPEAGGDNAARDGTADRDVGDGVGGSGGGGTGEAQRVPDWGGKVTAGGDIADERAGGEDSADDAQHVQDDGTRLPRNGETDGGEGRAKAVEGEEDTATDGKGGSEERQDDGQVENQEKSDAIVATGDELRVICERAVNVEDAVEDGKEDEGRSSSDEEFGLVGVQRVRAVLNEESDDEKAERGEDSEEFVFIAPPRDMLNRKNEMKVDGCDGGKELDKVEEKVCGVDRKREFEVGDCDERKRRKKDEEVVL